MKIIAKRIYLDYASLTPVDKRVSRVMKKFSKGDYTNPSSLYASGVKALRALDEAKSKVAKVIHAHADEIVFTSGGTESNRLVLEAFKEKEIIISEIEHSSIIKNAKAIKIKVDKDGLIDLEMLKKSINPKTALVSIMMVNNEIGTIEKIGEIAKIVRDYRKNNSINLPLLHTDASQAPIHMPIYVEKLGIDLLTLDGHKIYGPRGIGMLYVKRNTVKIERDGTENIPAIMGLTEALEIAERERVEETSKIEEVKKFFVEELQKINPEIKINGNIENSSPHILNVYIPNVDSEFLVLKLDARGIECSTKSACLRDEDESYVLKAIGRESKNSIRFSFGRETTKGEIKKVVKVLKEILSK